MIPGILTGYKTPGSLAIMDAGQVPTGADGRWRSPQPGSVALRLDVASAA
jgi:hypothetical protein